jgi:GTPase
VPQTTRNKVRGVYTAADGKGQLVFIDTPGYNISNKKFNNFLKDQAVTAVEESDLLLYLVDVTRARGEEENALLALVKASGKKKLAVLNKADVKPNLKAEITAVLAQELPGVETVDISALTGAGVPQLLDRLFDFSEEGDQFYPDDIYTDQLPEFRIREIIREKAILRTYQEVPHALYVHIEDMEMRQDGALLWVRGFLFVEKESQKGILIGRGGEKIKQILSEALAELEAIFPYKLFLDFRVKVDAHWKSNEFLLKKMFTGE